MMVQTKAGFVAEHDLVPVSVSEMSLAMVLGPAKPSCPLTFIETRAFAGPVCSDPSLRQSPTNGPPTDSWPVRPWSLSCCQCAGPEPIPEVKEPDVPVLLRGRYPRLTRSGTVIGGPSVLISLHKPGKCRLAYSKLPGDATLGRSSHPHANGLIPLRFGQTRHHTCVFLSNKLSGSELSDLKERFQVLQMFAGLILKATQHCITPITNQPEHVIERS